MLITTISLLLAAATQITTKQAATAAPAVITGTSTTSTAGTAATFSRSDAVPGTSYTSPDANSVARTFADKYHDVVSVADFGAVGSGDEHVALQAALNACNGGTLWFGNGKTYTTSVTLTVSHPCKLYMNGATVTQSTGNINGFNPTVGGVEFHDGVVNGPQHAVEQDSGMGINFSGSSAAGALSGLKLFNMRLTNWGIYGLYVKWANDIEVVDTEADNIFYAGMMFVSSFRIRVAQPYIHDIAAAGGIAGNAYGIAFTLTETGNLTTDPPSKDFSVTNGIFQNNTVWECIDTHDGQRGVIANNRLYNCKRAISVTTDNGNAIAPHDVDVVGNVADSSKTDGTADVCIGFVGISSVPGTLTDAATGSIVGNTCRGYGQDANGSGLGAALYIHSTTGLNVIGNTLINSSSTAILSYYDNVGINFIANSMVDTWSVAQGAARGLWFNSVNQTATISGNSCTLNGLAGKTHIGDRCLDTSSSPLTGVFLAVGPNTSAYTTYRSNFNAQNTNNGTATLSGGTATKTVMAGTSCDCTNTSAATVCKASVSGTTLTLSSGAGTDVVSFNCF